MCQLFSLLAGPSASAHYQSFALRRDLAVAGRLQPVRPAEAGTPARSRPSTSLRATLSAPKGRAATTPFDFAQGVVSCGRTTRGARAAGTAETAGSITAC